jgi:hypothetical protein
MPARGFHEEDKGEKKEEEACRDETYGQKFDKSVVTDQRQTIKI